MIRCRRREARALAVVLAVALVLTAGGCGAAKAPPMQFDHPNTSGPPAPLAVYIHGGGWSAGDKLKDDYYNLVKPKLLAQGVAVTTIDYRFAPKDRFPAQLVDVAYAVRYLRSNAKKLRIDPDRIATFGTSAGGHLASLLGTVDRSAGSEVGALKSVSSKVKAVVDISGPADLTDPAFPEVTDISIQAAFGVPGGTASDPTLTLASPIAHASPGDAPFLIVHGTVDLLVPYDQSVKFAKRLKEVGVPVELLTVTGGDHNLTAAGQSPAPAQLADRIAAFLVTELRR